MAASKLVPEVIQTYMAEQRARDQEHKEDQAALEAKWEQRLTERLKEAKEEAALEAKELRETLFRVNAELAELRGSGWRSWPS